MRFKTIYRKNIFNDEEILKIRDFFKKKSFFNNNMKFTDFDENDLLMHYTFSKKILNFLKTVLKDEIYFINSFVIQKNNRTSKKEKYHKDSGKIHQSKILSDYRNIYGKVGIPLQDNIKGEGGGIDYLRPMLFDNFSDQNKLKNKIRALYYKLQDRLIDTHLYSKTGDVLYFSAMMSHRTSLTEESKINFIKDKYVIYYQLTNLNTIKRVLKITRDIINEIELEHFEKDINIFQIGESKVKILNEKISKEIGSYMGL